MIKVIDTHCHPHHVQYDRDREVMLQRALDAGVAMIGVGVDWEASQKEIEIASQHDGMWASVGLHPNDNLGEQYDQDSYEKLASHPKVVAIGEVGLDYYRTTDEEKKKLQCERFERQIELAHQLRKPLIIHCRDAHADMIEILKANSYKLKAGGVIHSFTGTYADAKTYVELGFHIGLNGIITFARDYDDAVTRIPLEYILLETDAPYLTPEPYRGKRNEPAYVTYVAEQIARLRNLPIQEVIEQTTGNAKKLFGI